MRKLIMRNAFMKSFLHCFRVSIHYEAEKFRDLKNLADKVLREDSWSRKEGMKCSPKDFSLIQ